MKIGFVVGRFQNTKLHQGYLNLFKDLLETEEKFVIVMSQTQIMPTSRNPFTIEERVEILRKELLTHGLYDRFLTFLVVQDRSSDELWSQELDEIIKTYCKDQGFMNVPTLYGSRDSFFPYYSGSLRNVEVETSVPLMSSTKCREDLHRSAEEHFGVESYYVGKIRALKQQFPKVYPCVDIAIICLGKLLLGRKPHEKLFRFPGGFVDPTDSSYEDAALREAREECGASIELSYPRYVASLRVNDWRYKNEIDKIVSTLFVCHLLGNNEPIAGDDLQEVKWFSIEDLKNNSDFILPGHRSLLDKLLASLS